MRVLSLFSGGGLGDYGLELAGMEIVGQVEIDDYCQKILKLRWPDVPKWTDIKNVRGEEVIERCGAIDLVSGGFPCQGFSYAGKRRGKEDDRYLWPEMLRVISEVRPSWIFGENVVGIINTALDTVLSDLENKGYSCQAFIVPACAFDAPHRRDRVWILANSGHNGRCAKFRQQQKKRPEIVDSSSAGNVAYSVSDASRGSQWQESRNGKSGRKKQNVGERDEMGSNVTNCRWEWPSESGLDRVVDGCPNRLDRIKALGNGQVPQVVEWIGKRIMEFEVNTLV